MKTDAYSTMLAAALAYAVRWELFPANIAGKNKKSFKSKKFSNGRNWGKTKDPEEIKKDFKRWPKAIGIPTGADNGIFVVEADTKKGHDVDGIRSLRKLEADYGALPETLRAESPSGSVHYYFNWPADVNIINSTSKIAPGVDVRGEGGMVVAPPSIRDDGAYRWLNEGTPIADAPKWLIELATKDDAPAPTADDKPTPDYILKNADGRGKSFDPSDYNAPTAEPKRIAAAMAVIPNPDLGWEEWNKIGMTIWRASEGADAGRQIFHTWSKQSKKYDEKETNERWRHWFNHPPKKLGAGSIFRLANETAPNWWKKVSKPSPVVKERPTKENKSGYKIIETSGDFVAGFVPPNYLVDGILQRRYLYSLTAPTGAGKTSVALRIAIHVALGIPIEDIEVEKGKVLFMAGENPDDVRARWIKLCEEMEVEPEQVEVFFIDGVKTLSSASVRTNIENDAFDGGPLALVIIDTSAAYFEGDDENNNVEAGNHARLMRTYIELEGGPTILVTCHPIKNPNLDNLIPRGGGAFLNEVDGNLTCRKNEANMTVEVHWAGKIRGPDFAPIPFKLIAAQTDKLKDQKGRPMWTVYAEPISAEEMEKEDADADRRIDRVLRLLDDDPNISMSDIADQSGWFYKSGKSNKSLVQRIIKKLISDKLVAKQGRIHVVTPKGKEHLKEVSKL